MARSVIDALNKHSEVRWAEMAILVSKAQLVAIIDTVRDHEGLFCSSS
jgi:hypothetical protein